MKRITILLLCLSLVLGLGTTAFAAPPANLTWDGKPATLAEIDKNCGYADFYGESMADANGNYNPLWYNCAKELWEKGLFLGSGGSFDLDNPLTRAEGVVMTIRLLGKETEAKATAYNAGFTDVPDWAKPYVAYAVKSGIANGYNATTFGANDPMTAAQFITLTLRAMGYQDGTDFTWDKSYEKALAIKLFGKCEYEQYSRSNLFLRDDAVGIALNAVFYIPCKSGALLKDTIAMPGKPSGTVPTATRTDTTKEPGTPGTPTIDKQTELFLSRSWYAVWLGQQVRSGERPKGSGPISIFYNNDGTLSSYNTLNSRLLFSFSQPRIDSYFDIGKSAPDDEVIWNCRNSLADGTYDFAKDPASIGTCYLDSGDSIWLSLEEFRAATNNKNITQELFDTIKQYRSAASGSNAAIYYKKSAANEKYGYAIVLNLIDNVGNIKLGCPYFSLDPNDAFGKMTTVYP